MTHQISPIARRYATAFFDVILDKKADKAVASDIDSLKAMYEDGDVLSNFVKNRMISRDDKIQVIDAIAKKAKFHEVTANFLKILASNNRLSQLMEMIHAYDVVRDEHQGNTVVKVLSPFPLKKEQEKVIKGELDKVLGMNTKIVSCIDKTLLGGIIITVGSTMIDGSVRGQLEGLTRKMISQSDVAGIEYLKEKAS